MNLSFLQMGTLKPRKVKIILSQITQPRSDRVRAKVKPLESQCSHFVNYSLLKHYLSGFGQSFNYKDFSPSSNNSFQAPTTNKAKMQR